MFDYGRMSPCAVVPLLHELVDLHAWGRDADGWWALVSWSVYGQHDGGRNAHRYLSAWVAAGEVRPSTDHYQHQLYRHLERFDLPADRTAWPTPAVTAGREWHHYGAITAPPELPAGVHPVSGTPPPPGPAPTGDITSPTTP